MNHAQWLRNQAAVATVLDVRHGYGQCPDDCVLGPWDVFKLSCGHDGIALSSAGVAPGNRLYCAECLRNIPD